VADAVAARRPAPWSAILLAVLALGFLYRVADLVLVAFIAALGGMYLSGAADLACRYLRLPRWAGILLGALGTLAALSGIGFLLAPALGTQIGDLIAAAPAYLSALDEMVRRVAASSDVLSRTGIASVETGIVTTAVRDVTEFVQRRFFAYAAATGVIIVDGAAVLAMALYLAWRPAAYLDGILAVVPPRHRPVARAIAADLGATLKAWVGAQLLAMVLLAIATGIGLWLLAVPYWLAFAIFTGVAVMVPFFGSITSTILPALLVLPDRGLIAAVVVALVGVVVHVIEANVVHPLIMERRVALPPALTIVSVLAMGALAGLLGMVVAVPSLAVVIVLVRHIVVRQAYGEVPFAELAAEPAASARPGSPTA
jgi:predicted PurR-regulated permease PerM